MGIYRYFIDNSNPRSLNYKLRQARLRLFLSQIANIPRPVSILDVGGIALYWENLLFSMPDIRREEFSITITNINEDWLYKGMDDSNADNYTFEIADGRDMPQYSDGQFDIVHSNSVIEHVGDSREQSRMAKEVRRVGKRHFLQTPNFYFPIEPHFCAVGFHWLPRRIRMALVSSRKVGHLPRAVDRKHAEEIVDSAQLLSFSDLRVFFPESIIHAEKFLGLKKSFIVAGRGD